MTSTPLTNQKQIQVLIPMSGQGTRYQKVGYTMPKPMIPVSGVPMIERLLKKMPLEWSCVFVLADNHQDSGLKEMLLKLRPQAKVIYVPKHSEGPAFAIQNAIPHLDQQKSVLVSYCDYGMKWDAWDFEDFVQKTECDACVISYKGFHAHYLSPVTYAYSRVESELVKQVKEKGSFTDQRENEFASSGAYYFKDVDALEKAVAFQKANDIKMNNEYYTSLTVEALLQSNPKAQVRVYEIESFYQWGTPQDLKDFEYWEKTFQNLNLKIKDDAQGLVSQCKQILMPMAGLGSRIGEILNVAKPLVLVNGQPMYLRALESFPKAAKMVFVTLKQIAEKMHLTEKQASEQVLMVLEKTPEGQALTTEIGLAAIVPDQDFIVTACDHSVVLRSSQWNEFIQNPDCDAAIFTIRGFPGTRRKPKSYSYIQSAGSEKFPLIRSISVKASFTEDPSSEPLLIGTFWFKNKAIAQKGIDILKKNDVRVNNELYLDSVFTLLMNEGHKVREIPLDGYINWGDAESLKEALYWYEVFMGYKVKSREAYPNCK